MRSEEGYRAKKEFNGEGAVVTYLDNKGDNHEIHHNRTSHCGDGARLKVFGGTVRTYPCERSRSGRRHEPPRAPAAAIR